jgi:predicted alpha/beta superfamily hydrolase
MGSTASKNVFIIDSFPVQTLDRTRRIWVYLPETYSLSKKKYPVIYMHDGQNLFDESTSFSGEWGIDETMDSLLLEAIVVGIENGGNLRMNEYNPHDNIHHGKGEGLQYLEFIVKNLKPYIDKNYRTLKSRKNTLMAGSSMGGLITFYAGIYYPGIFGKLGVFSPAFWIADQITEEIPFFVKRATHSRQKYYFYGGGKENKVMERDIWKVYDLMQACSGAKMQVVINPEGQHNEAAWGKEFADFFRWIV